MLNMVNVVIVGTAAFDDIETPFGKKEFVLGGSAVYASLAASFFSKPGIVAIVGDDFPKQHEEFLKKKNICLKGLVKKGKTFHWSGKYEYDMNEAKTLKTDLNCLLEFNPILPEEYRKAKFLFLGNLDPELQIKVLEQMETPLLTVMDTMNFWITGKKEKLLEAISKIDVLVLNDGEARQLFETANLCAAAKKALNLGPKAVIIKKGEHGALLFSKDGNNLHFNAPGYPLEVIKDPTGCGDSFGGAFIGYLAGKGYANDLADNHAAKEKLFGDRSIRHAMIYGSVIASLNAEGFGTEKIANLTRKEIEDR